MLALIDFIQSVPYVDSNLNLLTYFGARRSGWILSIPREDMQIMNSSITGTSLVQNVVCRQLYLCVEYALDFMCSKRR